jgi:hypothetical protein
MLRGMYYFDLSLSLYSRMRNRHILGLTKLLHSIADLVSLVLDNRGTWVESAFRRGLDLVFTFDKNPQGAGLDDDFD